MSNPSGPDQGDEPAAAQSADEPNDGGAEQPAGETQPPETEHDAPTAAAPVIDDAPPPMVEEHPTEVMAVEETGTIDAGPPTEEVPAERRFTAPSGMDSSTTKFIEANPDPATEIISTPTEPMSSNKAVSPQMIPPRGDVPPPPPPPQSRRRSWGWVIALILVIAALAAVAILGTLLLTRDSDSKESQEQQVRSTIENFDVAVQKGDLATLRSITCGDHPRQLRELRRPVLDRHPRQGGRGQAVSGGGQHRPGRRQRRPRRGQRDDIHGVCAANQVDPQLRPAVPR